MRVATYVRMSTSQQEQSPEQQRKAIAQHAAKQGYTIVREYADLGISGDRTEKRVQFQRMIQDAVAGQFDRILCFDRSRFGRFDSLEMGSWCTPLRDAGVTLETVAEGIDDWNDFGGRIVGLIGAEGKHSFLVDLSRGVTRGLTAKAAAARGTMGGVAPYGYIRETHVEGRNRISEFKVDSVTAAVVRRMFSEYVKPGGSLTSVARMLNDDRIPTAGRGKLWRKNTVDRILSNRVYCGDYVWGRRSTGRYHSRQNGSEIVKRRPSDPVVWTQPIEHLDAVPAIVSRQIFSRAQSLMIERQKQTRGAASISPLSGLVVCATCGQPMHSDGNRSFRCPSSRSERGSKRSCTSARVPSAPMLSAVIDGLQSKLLNPATLAKIEKAIRSKADAAGRGNRDAERADLEQQRRKLEGEVAEGVARIPLVPRSIMPDLTKSLEAKAAERDRLAAAIAALPKGNSGPCDAVERSMKALRDLRSVLPAASPAVVNAALRAAGVRVTTRPAPAAVKQRTATVSVGTCPHQAYGWASRRR